MKKLMMALGVVALAATVQAATFRWYQGSPVSPSDDATGQISSGTLYLFSGSGQSALLTGYVAALAADPSSGVDYLTGATGYVGSGSLSSSTKFASTTVAGATVTSGRVVWSETTTDTTRSYFQVLVDGDNIYISESVSPLAKAHRPMLSVKFENNASNHYFSDTFSAKAQFFAVQSDLRSNAVLCPIIFYLSISVTVFVKLVLNYSNIF